MVLIHLLLSGFVFSLQLLCCWFSGEKMESLALILEHLLIAVCDI